MLSRIIDVKKGEVRRLKRSLNIDNINFRTRRFNPLELCDSQNRVKVIAEVKKSSPLKGVICKEFDHLKLARTYADCGAAAISVISDKRFFEGDKEYLYEIQKNIDLPVLRKDFIIDEVQLYETLMLGADIVLLIAAVHDYTALRQLCEKSLELGIEPLVEIHNKDELAMVVDLPINVVGVNNRNLQDFRVDINTSIELGDMIPSSCIKISESGINNTRDMRLLEECGYDAALIGEALVTSSDPGRKLKELVSYRELMDYDRD